MLIQLVNKDDALHIATIHYQEIHQGFLSQLGIKFLTKLYQAMTDSSLAFIITAKEHNQIIGFISGCANIKKFYRYFLKKYFFSICFILLPKIFKISVLKKIRETLKYKNIKNNLPQAELLTIAVSKKFQGQGVAQTLLTEFIKEMRKRKVTQFKVIVGEKLSRAIAFYEKMGFKFLAKISIHQGQSSRIYIYDL